MKTLQEIRKFYEVGLRDELEQLQEQRNGIRRKSVFLGIVIASAAAVLFIVLWRSLDLVWGPLAILVFFSATLWVALTKYLDRHNRLCFKNTIITRLLHHVDENLLFSASGGVPETDFVTSKLFNRKLDKYTARNLVWGRIDATHVLFSQINVTYPSIDYEDLGGGYKLFFGMRCFMSAPGRACLAQTFSTGCYGRFSLSPAAGFFWELGDQP